MTAMPWSQLFRSAVTVLGIDPGSFWRMSLAEWNMLARGNNEPFARANLDALLARYPDKKS